MHWNVPTLVTVVMVLAAWSFVSFVLAVVVGKAVERAEYEEGIGDE